jgi:hypothetical protein
MRHFYGTVSVIALIVVFALLAPFVGVAQQPPPAPDPQQQVIGSMLIEAVQREAAARMQLIQAQQENAALKAQAAAKPAEAPKPDAQAKP